MKSRQKRQLIAMCFTLFTVPLIGQAPVQVVDAPALDAELETANVKLSDMEKELFFMRKELGMQKIRESTGGLKVLKATESVATVSRLLDDIESDFARLRLEIQTLGISEDDWWELYGTLPATFEEPSMVSQAAYNKQWFLDEILLAKDEFSIILSTDMGATPADRFSALGRVLDRFSRVDRVLKQAIKQAQETNARHRQASETAREASDLMRFIQNQKHSKK